MRFFDHELQRIIIRRRWLPLHTGKPLAPGFVWGRIKSIRSGTDLHDHRIHPEWFLTYGTTKYFDPANKQAQQFVVDVVADIVKRYDVDAIHMDDYFYPYRIPGKEFPDDASYRSSGTKLNKDDWRRSNVDSNYPGHQHRY